MSIIALIESDGGTLKKAAATNGGEYAGACPFCGGKDRFRVWPEEDRYWCRSCGKAGDSIEYLRERRGLSYVEACNVLGCDPGPRKGGPLPVAMAWAPKEASSPADAWQEKARSFLDGAISCLWSERGASMRAWLHDVKGLSDTTIRTAGLGLSLSDTFDPRECWGLPPSPKDDGTARRQWLPRGLVIPHIVGGTVHRMRIRRDDPGEGKRYVVVSGSNMTPMVLNPERAAAIVVESELDAILLSQETGDLVTCISMGTAPAKPDVNTHATLTAAAVILISLDTDDAGARAAWAFWPSIYGDKAKRWPSIGGKDPSEAMANGLDLWTWVAAGIFGTEERFERFCIQTIDGGLNDGEAIRAMEVT